MNLRSKRILLAFLLAVAACQPVPKDQAHFAKGFKAYEDGDFYTALLYLKPLVEAGNPAAQLLLARMYSEGQGVEEDAGKAELLRNLAASKFFGRVLPPGRVHPATGELKEISDRLDYFVEGPRNGKSIENLSQLLASIDLKTLHDLGQALPADMEELPGSAASLPVPSAPSLPAAAPGPLPERTAAPAPPRDDAKPAEKPMPARSGRGADQISLSLLRQAADQGDVYAMTLLSAAYANGYYGLTPNREQARNWAQQARHALRKNAQAAASADDAEEAVDRRLLFGMCAASGIGAVLIGLGLWRHRARRKRRLR